MLRRGCTHILGDEAMGLCNCETGMNVPSGRRNEVSRDFECEERDIRTISGCESNDGVSSGLRGQEFGHG